MKISKQYAALYDGQCKRFFVKIYSSRARDEFSKAAQLFAIGQDSEIFATPQPLKFIEDYSIIVWEYLPNLVDLRTFLFVTSKFSRKAMQVQRDVVRLCGKALALIHSSVKVDENCYKSHIDFKLLHKWPEFSRHVNEVLNTSPTRPIHGDFACANIFVQSPLNQRPRLIILDSSPNAFLFHPAYTYNIVSIYWEIGQFISSLHSRLHFRFPLWNQISVLTSEFLRGYEEVSLLSVDNATSFVCAAETLYRYTNYQENRTNLNFYGISLIPVFRRLMTNYLLKVAIAKS